MNRINIDMLSKITYLLSSSQWNKFLEITQTMNNAENSIETLMSKSFKINSSIFLNSLIEKEALDSSRIEGTQTNHDEIFYDIEGIGDVYSWETRNLINLYKDTFVRLERKSLRFNVERLREMHEKLYFPKVGKNQTFDSSAIINKIKPGTIITDDRYPNWIGPKGKGIDKAKLILISPSKKIGWLEDMFKTIMNSKNKRETILFLHPIFEAIHPFADGNGRLGRLILTASYKYLGITKNNWFFFSDIIEQEREEYLDALYEVQVSNNWAAWIDYFLELMKKTANKRKGQIDLIIELIKDILEKNSKIILRSDHINDYGYVFRSFIKYPRLNKGLTVKTMIGKRKTSSSTAYRIFDYVANLIGATKYGDDQYEFTSLLKIVRN